MLEAVIQRMDEWRRLGLKEAPDGSRIIAHTPRDFPEAYLHRFFAPRPMKEWETYGLKLLPQIRELYSECNGLSIFGGALEIYGIRAHYRRDDSAQFQPYDLLLQDEEHRCSWHPLVKRSPERRVFFGSFSDGSGIYVEAQNPAVRRVLRGASNPVNEWPDVRSFLEAEFDRMSKLFTPSGYLLQKDLSTAPEPKRSK
ncbi:MAG: SMI1/KNR4 family protein [Verrucomicrobiae bacterium]|nr:SMI1/KNR4 family protein [Verrucomicrobiae bacterium]